MYYIYHWAAPMGRLVVIVEQWRRPSALKASSMPTRERSELGQKSKLFFKALRADAPSALEPLRRLRRRLLAQRSWARADFIFLYLGNHTPRPKYDKIQR